MNNTKLETALIPTPTTPTRQPFVEPLLTEQGDLSEVTAGALGDMSP